jgi:hypothetical protein
MSQQVDRIPVPSIVNPPSHRCQGYPIECKIGFGGSDLPEPPTRCCQSNQIECVKSPRGGILNLAEFKNLLFIPTDTELIVYDLKKNAIVTKFLGGKDIYEAGNFHRLSYLIFKGRIIFLYRYSRWETPTGIVFYDPKTELFTEPCEIQKPDTGGNFYILNLTIMGEYLIVTSALHTTIFFNEVSNPIFIDGRIKCHCKVADNMLVTDKGYIEMDSNRFVDNGPFCGWLTDSNIAMEMFMDQKMMILKRFPSIKVNSPALVAPSIISEPACISSSFVSSRTLVTPQLNNELTANLRARNDNGQPNLSMRNRVGGAMRAFFNPCMYQLITLGFYCTN